MCCNRTPALKMQVRDSHCPETETFLPLGIVQAESEHYQVLRNSASRIAMALRADCEF